MRWSVASLRYVMMLVTYARVGNCSVAASDGSSYCCAVSRLLAWFERHCLSLPTVLGLLTPTCMSPLLHHAVDEEEVAEFVAETGSSADEAALVLEAIDNLKEAVANFYKSAGGWPAVSTGSPLPFQARTLPIPISSAISACTSRQPPAAISALGAALVASQGSRH